jgi:hypothetical protein
MPLTPRSLPREGPDVISSEAAFAAWAPDGVLWSDWAKPAPFVHAGGVLVNDPVDDNALPHLPLGLDSRSAVIVDLPSEESVYAGVALADRGFRPVPLFNGTNGPSPVVDVAPIVEALGRAADRIRARLLAPEAAPAFLLDSRRQSGLPKPGMYDNRWVVLPQDFPSGTLLASRGILNATLIQRGPGSVPQDLAHVLRRWQDQGIHLHTIDLETGLRSDIKVARPSWFRLAWYAAIAVMGLRRSNVGGFGSMIPEQTSRSGFYG